jgi:hypothetical protein
MEQIAARRRRQPQRRVQRLDIHLSGAAHDAIPQKNSSALVPPIVGTFGIKKPEQSKRQDI